MVTKHRRSRRLPACGMFCAFAMVISTMATVGPPAAAAGTAGIVSAPADDELAIVSDTLVSLTPARYVDTRPGFATFDAKQAGDGKLGPAAEYEIEIAGRGDVPADAAAVVVNVTAVQTEDRGYVTLHPCVTPRPLASSLNYVAGVNVGNEVVASLSTDGTICAFTNRNAHLTVDVVGYVPATGEIAPLVPARLLDTRPGFATIDGLAAGAGRTAVGSTTTVPVAGRGGVATTDVHSVLVNVTAVNADARGFVVAHGCLANTPSTSSLNFIAGVNRGNELLVEVDAAGDICLFTSTDIHLTVDVVGYTPVGSTVATTVPARLADSRPGRSTDDGVDAGFGKQVAGSQYEIQVTGRGGVPADAKAAVVNVTAVAPESKGWFTVHPCVTPRPLASSLNYIAGVNGGNELIAGLSPSGSLCVYTNTTSHFTIDLVGYLADSAAPMADLALTKIASADQVNAGDTLTYTVTVTNNGPDDAENVRVTDELPDELTLLSTTGCAADPAGLPLCELGEIANGASKQFTIDVSTASDAVSSTLSNTATVASDTADPLGGNNTATVTSALQAVGTIVIQKSTEPAGGTGFSFTDDIAAPNSFSLDDGQSETFLEVPEGAYTVTETDPSPVTLVSITCDDGASATPSTGVAATGVASIGLDPGETVTCTYVNNLNLAPTITSDGGGATASVNAAENQTAVTDVQATDDLDTEGAGLTYAITGGADQALFDIDTNTGVLTFGAAPDFENPTDAGGDNVYDVQVTLTDAGPGPGLTDAQDIAVTVTDANDAPIITSDGGGATASVNAAENQTAVTTVTATDEDLPSQTLTATITGGADQALFSITPTGVLTFDTAPDFENPTDTGGDNVYDVQVTITDNGAPNLTDTQDIAVTVTDVEPETPPTAVNDAYAATGNVSLTVAAGDGVLLGTGADTGPGLTVTDVQGVAANVSVATDTDATGASGIKGSVTVATDGSFTYRPPPGYVGNDQFTYEVSNGAGTDTATVTIAITDVIWFVDDTSTGANRGTLADPFTSTTSLNTAQGAAAPAPTNDQTIFVDTGSGTYTDGVVLRSGQKLIGAGSSADIPTAAGITLAPFSDALPTTAGTPPIVSDASGDGIDLSTNNTVRGMSIGNTLGYGLDSEASAGTLSVSEVAITGTGGGVDIAGGAADPINVALTSLATTSSSAHGIRLAGTAGTLNVLDTGGTIATTNLPAIDVQGSATTVTFNGTVIANSGAANGINLVNNTGATITIGGQLDIDTTTGIGFNAIGGGTVVANGAGSDIDTAGGIGVNVVNTAIGGAGPTISGTDLVGSFGLSFQSVSVAGATNAIVLDNAGTGGFTITGTGADGSGGSLANTTSDAIVLRNGTQNVELTNVAVAGTGQHGVVATGVVTNLIVNDSQFTDIGNAAGEEAFSFDNPAGNNIAGQLTLNDVDVTRFYDNGINVFATSGTVSIDVINGSDFVDGADGTPMGQAIIVETEGSAGADLNVNGSLFDDVETDAVRFEAGGSGTNNVDVVGNTVTDPGGPDNFPNGGSFQMIVTDARTLTFDIQGNTQNDLPGDGIIVAATTGGGNISGRIGGPGFGDGNVINGGVDSLGIPVSDGILVTDIGVDATIAETMTLLIQNNTINAGGGDDGIQFSVGDNDGTYDVTIRDNTISNTSSEGIRFFFDDDNTQSPDLDLDVVNNDFVSIGDGAIELATRDAGTACANVTDNSNGAAGSPGTILFDERAASSISVPQASDAAIAAANNGATVTIQTNPLTFNTTCTTTLPSHP